MLPAGKRPHEPRKVRRTAADPESGERPGMGKTRKGKFKMSAEFSAKSLIKALTNYKLEAIAEMKKVRAAVEAEK